MMNLPERLTSHAETHYIEKQGSHLPCLMLACSGSNRHSCHTPVSGIRLFIRPVWQSCISTAKILIFAAVSLLASSFQSNAEARSLALRVELPDVKGWRIEAINRGGSSVSCSARPKNEDIIEITMLAGTVKYRGGMWYMGVVSRSQHLEPGVKETEARLFLNGRQVTTGKAWATGDKRTPYVHFDFPAIDDHINGIKEARFIDIQTEGLSPLKIESLPSIIFAIEECQQKGQHPGFWENAERVCN